MRPPEETPLAMISTVSQLSCALVDPVGPILLVCRFPVLGRDLGPAVSLVCIAPHDEPSGRPLWHVCETVFDRQGSTILQQTDSTGFSNHVLTSCDCAKLHELAKFTCGGSFIDSLQSCAQVYPHASAMKIPDAQAAADKEWEKLEKSPAWQITKVKSKREVIQEAQREQRTVHFATLMDICHLKIVKISEI